MISLMEDVILHKLSYYSDLSRANKSDITTIYPQCLYAFLLANLNKHFVFVKLSIYVSYGLRYSGRNIDTLIRHLSQDQYQSLLMLETKLVTVCELTADISSNLARVSEINIVETYNESEKRSSEKKNGGEKKGLLEKKNGPINKQIEV